MHKAWVQSLPLHQLGMVVHAYTPSPQDVAAGGTEFKDILGYIVSLRLAWAS